MTRFRRSMVGLAAAGALAMATVAAQGRSAAKPAAKALAAAKGSGHESRHGTQLGLIDVQPSDLLQKTIKNNWVSYNGDYTGRRFSSLAQVTPANVRHLAAKWVFHTQNAGVLQVTPVVVAGVMFITGSNDAYALDARTGTLLWRHARGVSPGLIDDASGHINRGVALLGTRVYMETDNAHLLCLDARSGNLIWDVAYADNTQSYGATSAPLIVKDKVLVGTSGGDDGVRGFVAAFDAQTGKEVWRFWTIPAPGEKGSETWPVGEDYLRGGGTAWMPGTYDPELNTIYWGTGNAAPDFDGSVRPGDNLYTSSLVALDPDTGKMKWYFQFNPHDLYDYDSVQTPVLVDAKFKNKPRKLIVTANRNGFLYILDRATGEYLYSKQFMKRMNWAKGIDKNGRPISNNLIPDAKGVLVCPGIEGATNWYSPSYDPLANMFYFRSLEACDVIQAKKGPFQQGRPYYSTGARTPPGNVPSDGYINAFDLTKLDFAWRDKQIGERQAWAGVMTTAGGLVAFGNDANEFEMDDARTGKPLWAFKLGQPMHASPMSYGIQGKQYFAVAAGDDVFAFALP
ncbi:MAG: PQQ-dependent dehydrogenase, methanol/ethanol family [Acidobacteriaceae bacterium]